MTTQEDPVLTNPAATSLANRYGSPKRGLAGLTAKSRKFIIMIAVILGVLFMAWVATSSAVAPVSSKDISYTANDPTQTEVEFQVTKDPQATAQCAIKALDSSFAVVGWKVVELGPNGTDVGSDGGRTTITRVGVRTESPAVSGVVDQCWISNKG
ncbi:DUF4307 domain-containing protein [Pseudarthrobacter sp. J1738]|uniref:DUF4307 domain-containing protein n=1 Tax=unclassified Pseudarthrobacter TaxID=2647000 RepID=UPI003D2D1332